MISLATPKQVAGKIASAHNRHECKHCRRRWPKGGVLAFGLSGSDARWYPDEDTARRETAGVRYIYPADGPEVTSEQVIAWLEQGREEMEQLIEYVERQREEKRMERAYQADQHGFRTDPYPCADCGEPKHRPADRCDHCGDEPCPIGIPHHDYNRGYGYRD